MENAKNQQDGNNVPVVALGASAGGLASLELFFKNIPADTGFAYVVVQHLAPSYKSFMPEILSRVASIPVVTIKNNMPVAQDTIYWLPPMNELSIDNGILKIRKIDVGQGETRPVKPIDHFFSSLSRDYERQKTVIILSGTGSDGSLGVVDAHNAAAKIYIENPETAKFDGMPNSAMITKTFDFVGTASEIAERTVESSNSQRKEIRRNILDKLQGSTKDKILDLINEEYDVDFNLYKIPTIDRRLGKRMEHLHIKDLDKYLKYLVQNPKEIANIYYEILIGVTELFRDKEAFDLISSSVIPGILSDNVPGKEVRIWVAGCASGEEAYSLAILFLEAIEKLDRHINIKIFATDVDSHILDKAGLGIYEQDNALVKSYMGKYFEEKKGCVQVTSALRRCIVFTRHNLLKDPPFMNMDLISCRNLLIYFKSEAQDKALSTFLFSLKRYGYLFLGPSEQIKILSNNFDTIHSKWKIYRKTHDIKRLRDKTSMRPAVDATTETNNPRSPVVTQNMTGIKTEDAMEVLLQSYIPPSLMLNDEMDIIHIFGDAGKYISFKPGKALLNIKALTNESLAHVISASIDQCRVSRQIIEASETIKVEGSVDKERFYNVIVRPLGNSECIDPIGFLVSIDEGDKGFNKSDMSGRPVSLQEIESHSLLVEELKRTKANLYKTVSELEITNEEFQATNQEMLVANEELQCSNEELNSVNDELYSVNLEYHEKIDELVKVTQDEDNLLNCTDIGTIFLDSQLRIRKFTPAIQKYFRLLTTDIGRQLSDISCDLDVDEILRYIHSVIKTMEPVQYEKTDKSGNYFLIKIHPYKTFFESGDGAIISFVDVSEVKKAEITIKEKVDALEKINQDLEAFAYVVSHDLKAPLRTIGQLAQSIEEEIKDKLSPDNRKNFEDLFNLKRNMEALIDGILKYSVAGKEGARAEPVNVNDLLNTIIKAQSPVHQNAIEISRGMPTLTTEKVKLEQVFLNLIGNAIKYGTTDKSTLCINIGCIELEDFFQFSVGDNGDGIPEQHQGRIFTMFKTLDFPGKEKGTGIGLAVVKRIVESQGGRITVNSLEGKGATFSFTWPKQMKGKEPNNDDSPLHNPLSERDLVGTQGNRNKS
ncbi:MAG: hypothetical protein G3M78_12585 [Candidatus Nitrohelix vancouverensis]|uniref:Chemotaxis protein CheR n=1 Tax=Candidatus Nitrohelix vancouverensis TaxID=2705534 RepID=A0A7T0G4B1_9BACT|nr:MAG: hypothetical protein G3M78_12585 [Candidatus Nitrohelix vancouverensis]